MVNYARMETVWRSYGPLEPIGSSISRPRRRPRKALAASLAAVCVAGAAAGLYLRPDLTELQSEAAAPPDPMVRVSDPQPQSEASPAEAARLQSQLQMLVLGGVAPSASAGAPAPPAAANGEAQAVSSDAASAAALAPPTAPVRAAPARRSEPMVLASRTPAPLVLPSAAARSRSPRNTRVSAASEPASAPADRPAPAEAADLAAPEPDRQLAAGPAYDCSAARSAAERIVCASPELAALDRNMAAELEAAVAAGHSPRELARDQASWRRRRDKAAPDPRAVADMYRQRIGQLRSMQ